MKLSFTKMQGTGNDFVVLNAYSRSLNLSVDQYRFLANRHYGIGCDQILVVEKAQHRDIDFRYRIFNADGSEVEQCGNGARCFAKYVYKKGLTNKKDIRVETNSGVIVLHITDDEKIVVDMGSPNFIPELIPLNVEHQSPVYEVTLEESKIQFSCLSLGNPHAVVLVDDISAEEVDRIGLIMGKSSLFPNGVNVGFMQVLDSKHLLLRVFERGVGETLACGTGACAAVVAGINMSLLDNHVEVKLSGGSLLIDWDGQDSSVRLAGDAKFVFEGEIDIN